MTPSTTQTSQDNALAVFEVMKERHAVKKFQPDVKIDPSDLKTIFEMACTAPSSWDLQHWKFLVVQEPAGKERLYPIAYNQQQVKDASAVVVVLADVEANRNAHAVYDHAVKNGHMPEHVADTIMKQIEDAYSKPGIGHDEALRNASLAAMQLMLAAKAKGYDTCPMGGFDRVGIIKELGIPERYIPTMIIAMGKAAPSRPSTAIRFPVSEVVIKEHF